jgi:putative CocE/NonD family hydrolase
MCFCTFTFGAHLFGQPPAPIADQYVKHEYKIPMRDGIKLFTSVYSPKDTSEGHPIVIFRTPYSIGPYGEDKFWPNLYTTLLQALVREKCIIVGQDVRGRYMSEGVFEDVRPYKPNKKEPKDIDESSDTYDTVDWLIKNVRHHNGRASIQGNSYGGFYAWMGAIDAHPAVRAVYPSAPVSEWMGGDDFFHHGALLLPHAFDFYGWFGWPRPHLKSEPDRGFDQGMVDEYKYFLELGPLSNINTKCFHDSVGFWTTITRNGQWNEFWAARNILPHLKNLRPAALVTGGWFDTENLFGALNSYAANERQSLGAQNMLVMGPWFHGQWNADSGYALGSVRWGSPTATFFLDSIYLPFFRHYLKGAVPTTLPEAYMFNTGANVWRRFDAWPPKNVVERSLYFESASTLSFKQPATGDDAYDEYVNDPSHPVPYTGETAHWYNPGFMVEDQRFASRRPDVLVYATGILDRDLTIAGPIEACLSVSTSGTDADWVVKLIDVFPDTLENSGPWSAVSHSPVAQQFRGYEMLVRGDVLRGKFRKSLSKPEPFVPGEVTPVAFVLNDALHTFRKGHRIMVQVQSSWFPMIDRNPGRFLDIYKASAGDFQKTTQRVYRSSSHPSFISVGVLQ